MKNLPALSVLVTSLFFGVKRGKGRESGEGACARKTSAIAQTFFLQWLKTSIPEGTV